MKYSDRIDFRVTSEERSAFEELYQAWSREGKLEQNGRYARARIWSRSNFARELLRQAMRLRGACLPVGEVAP